MISTRLHGMIDYGVATLFAGLAASRILSPPARRTLGLAGAYHASYSVATDYEAGLRPWLTMRQHLVLDAIGGAALCATGWLDRRQPSAERALLFAAGASELAIVALSRGTPVSGPGQGGGLINRLLARDPADAARVGYPPLDTPKPVTRDVFVVDSLLPGLLGRMVAARMTVIRLADGTLLLHSPTRFSPGLRRTLEAIGPIRHLVAPNIAHWTFLAAWQRHCPGVTTWAAPGLRDRAQVKRNHIRLDYNLGASAPEAWGNTIALETIPGSLGFQECALFHIPTRTLVLTDIVQNLEPHKLPLLLRPLIRLFGTTPPDGGAPPYLRAVVKARRADAVRGAGRLLDLRPDRVVFAHGAWFETNGAARLRRSLQWLVD